MIHFAEVVEQGRLLRPVFELERPNPGDVLLGPRRLLLRRLPPAAKQELAQPLPGSVLILCVVLIVMWVTLLVQLLRGA